MRPAPERPVIALLGLRCSGKSTLGRVLAARLGRPFVDLDQELLAQARRAGVRADSAGELLARHGEAAFRTFEADALRRVLEPGPRLVLATGGGVVERSDNRVWLARAAHGILLDVPLPVLVARRVADASARPLLAGSDVASEYAELWRRRAPLYRALAAAELACGEAPPQVLVERLLELLEGPGKDLRKRAETPDLVG